MVRGAYLTVKRGLRVVKVDLLGLMVSPEYGQGCLPHYEERPPCGLSCPLSLVVSPEYDQQLLTSL
jgi:hypothetical protein